MGKWLWYALSLVAAILLAVMATTPPGPASASAPAGEFSAGRAMADVEAIGATPHPTGSAENAKVRAYLVERLNSLGFEVTEVDGPLDDYSAKRLAGWSGDKGPPPRLTNIIARMPGTDSSLPAVAMMAHHDTVWGSPGAADDTAGVAAILEAARAIVATGQTERDVYVIFTDGEELGLSGAAQFFASNPAADRIGAVINLEARGGGGIANLFQLSPNNGAAAKLYAEVVSRPATSSLAAFLYSVLPNDTDLSETLRRGGYVAYNIAFIGRPELYHSPMATPARLDQGSLQHMGDQTLALARSLAVSPDLPAATADAVFFDVFGLVTLVYAPWIGWLMLAASAGALIVAWRKTVGQKGLGAGVGRMLALLLASGLLLYALNWISGSGGDYYDRLAAIPRLIVMAALTLGASWLLVFGKSPSTGRERIGAALPLLLIAIAGQALAPTASYFIVIPVMIVALLGAFRLHARGAIGLAACAAFAAVITGYMLGLGYWTMQGVGASIPFVVALPAALAMMSWLVLWPGWKPARSAAGLLLLAALAIALWVRFDAVPPSVAVYATDKPG